MFSFRHILYPPELFHVNYEYYPTMIPWELLVSANLRSTEKLGKDIGNWLETDYDLIEQDDFNWATRIVRDNAHSLLMGVLNRDRPNPVILSAPHSCNSVRPDGVDSVFVFDKNTHHPRTK